MCDGCMHWATNSICELLINALCSVVYRLFRVKSRFLVRCVCVCVRETNFLSGWNAAVFTYTGNTMVWNMYVALLYYPIDKTRPKHQIYSTENMQKQFSMIQISIAGELFMHAWSAGVKSAVVKLCCMRNKWGLMWNWKAFHVSRRRRKI